MMKLLRESRDFKSHAPESVLTVGVFDGVHLGHRRIISECVREASKRSVTSVVLTFESNPRKVLSEAHPCLITSPERKLEILDSLGVDVTIVLSFTPAYSRMAASEFCRKVLKEDLGAMEVCVGENFHFGKGAEGDASYLTEIGEKMGFDVRVVKMLSLHGETLSSTLIRGLINEGRLKEVNLGLGRPFSVVGKVERGKARGKSMGFPTANLSLERPFCIPSEGVYAAVAELGGVRYPCAVNVGSNPTFENGIVAVEAYLIDFGEDIYGETVEVEFHEWIREEIAFSNQEELVLQIEDDVLKVKEILAGGPATGTLLD
jgi:riboflavin kinase / FMN adenylyltransferase